MSIWGKLGGAGFGLAIGGPIGGLLGAFAGHYLIDREGSPFGPAPRDVVLTTGLVALSAKMARADGVVACSEVEAFSRVVVVPDEDRASVERLFRLAQATTDGFQAYAAQLAKLLADEPALLDDIVDGLFLIAQADHAVHEAEIAYLREVARIFGRDEAWFEAALARHVVLPDDPYRVLGVDRSASYEELRRRYRQLVADTHPDREIARGLPPEAVKIANDRLSAINAAWDRIERERQAA
ncbi:J domain-containing protein [Enterovirga aerilata]|uniref:DnaJ family molecular chaperone n=1 Tax=Enterovirga aerilata TaxID=2730920 RepID=A0A849I3V9_9HYPH|nr:DnaJ family molecular chaperone [Enterovirga sp. DB1703]NNM70830.1 DnaJ family molecular chaperone [Enterovirga sp. DB1703]